MSHQCPTCNEEFKSKSGMKSHHKLKHGESISGEVQNCKNCGQKIRVRPCRTDLDNTCSEKCQNELHSDKMSGSGSPTWSGGTDKITCDMCGSEFKEYESQRTGENAFCSKSCYNEYRSVFIRGPNHPNWKDKPDYNYSNGWQSLADSIRKRDTCCVICGEDINKYKNKFDRKPDVHHIIPSDVFDKDRGDFELNLLTLCRSCHRNIEEKSWGLDTKVLLSLAHNIDI